MRQYFGNGFSTLTQAVNAWVFAGNPNESVSARAYRCHQTSKFWYGMYQTINTVFFWEDSHCKNAFIRDAAAQYEYALEAAKILQRCYD